MIFISTRTISIIFDIIFYLLQEEFMQKGFTLIELLVVTLIMGILASVAWPQYQKAVAKTKMMETIHTAAQKKHITWPTACICTIRWTGWTWILTCPEKANLSGPKTASWILCKEVSPELTFGSAPAAQTPRFKNVCRQKTLPLMFGLSTRTSQTKSSATDIPL